MSYKVYIEKNGISTLAGCLKKEPAGVCFSYAGEYIDSLDPSPISVNLPIQKESFSSETTACFFEGLLPEGYTRRFTEKWLHIDNGNYENLLYALGRECLGAIKILAEEDKEEFSYEPISTEKIKELASEGISVSTEMVTKAHLSLAGASGKAGLYLDEKTGKWYLPVGIALSTHIVKLSHIRLGDIVLNEQLSMMTAKKCGIETPESFIINTGEGTEKDVLFATKRYDRLLNNESVTEKGLRIPFRLHQEDFAQALGISGGEKYEKPGRNYLKQMFNLIKNTCDNPIADQIKLWERVVFNLLIGNTDAHVKNYSLLYSHDLKNVRLAPAYDIISTTAYEGSSRELAMDIGGEYNIDAVTKEDMAKEAENCEISSKMAVERYEKMADVFVKNLRESANQLFDEGFKRAHVIEERILSRRRV